MARTHTHTHAHTQTQTHMHAQTHTHTHTHTHTCSYSVVHANTHTHSRTHTHTHRGPFPPHSRRSGPRVGPAGMVSASACVYVCVRVRVCVCVYMHIYVCVICICICMCMMYVSVSAREKWPAQGAGRGGISTCMITVVLVVLQWYHSGVTMVLQLCCSGVYPCVCARMVSFASRQHVTCVCVCVCVFVCVRVCVYVCACDSDYRARPLHPSQTGSPQMHTVRGSRGV
jgi:hypothetical protein